MRTRSFLQLMLVLLWFGLAGCGGDDPTRPSGGGGGGSGVTFPSIDANVLALLCVRGNQVAPGSVQGTIDANDCQPVVGDGFGESWRVRVASSGSITFAVSSNFDSYLELIRVNDVNDYVNSIVLLDEDDDSGPGMDATLTFQLEPNTEYAIAVSGYDDTETGSYTVTMN